MKLNKHFGMYLAAALIAAGLVCAQPLMAAMTATGSGGTVPTGQGGGTTGGGPSTNAYRFPAQQIQDTLQAKGRMENGVLHMELKRGDIGLVAGPMGVTFTPAFGLHGDLFFQPLANKLAFVNGDLALTEPEVNSFISALLTNGLVFQAFHQHTPMAPQVWFVHFRGIGGPLVVAQAVRNAIAATHTPMPQYLPENPITQFDTNQLAEILHGSVSVGDEGVVTITVPRRDQVHINGLRLNPAVGISTTIEFRPTGGNNAEVVANFSMTAPEVNPVGRVMLNQFGWYQGCLYNQEINENPQLFFNHMVKTGDANVLAQEIREGLNRTRSR